MKVSVLHLDDWKITKLGHMRRSPIEGIEHKVRPS